MVHPSTVSSIYSVRFGGIYSAKAAAWCRYAAAAGTFFPACCCGWAGAAGWPDGMCGGLGIAASCYCLFYLGTVLRRTTRENIPAYQRGIFAAVAFAVLLIHGTARLCGSGGQWIQQPDFPAGCQPGGLGAGAGGRVPDRSPALSPGGAGLSGPCDDADCDFTLFELKLVTWLGLLATGGEPYLLAAFPIYFTGGAWWLAYTAAGLVLPLAANAVYKKIKNAVLAH